MKKKKMNMVDLGSFFSEEEEEKEEEEEEQKSITPVQCRVMGSAESL